MKLFILTIFVVLVQLSYQLPVKESSTTEKDPNKHSEEGDSATHNLENVIGKFHKLP